MTYLEAFEVLELNADASPEQVHAQYKKLAKKYHPDRHVGADAARKKYLAKKFSVINEAYEQAMKFLEYGPEPSVNSDPGRVYPEHGGSPVMSRDKTKPPRRWMDSLLFRMALVSPLAVFVLYEQETRQQSRSKNATTREEKLDEEQIPAIDPRLLSPLPGALHPHSPPQIGDALEQFNAQFAAYSFTPRINGLSSDTRHLDEHQARKRADVDRKLKIVIASAEDALDRNDVKQAFFVLDPWVDFITSHDDATRNTTTDNARLDFLRVLYRAQSATVEMFKFDSVEHGRALFHRSKTLHAAMNNCILSSDDISAHRLYALATASYLQAIELLSPYVGENSTNKQAIRTTVAALESYGALLVDYGRYSKQNDYYEKAKSYFDRSAELCRFHPDVADVLF